MEWRGGKYGKGVSGWVSESVLLRYLCTSGGMWFRRWYTEKSGWSC